MLAVYPPNRDPRISSESPLDSTGVYRAAAVDPPAPRRSRRRGATAVLAALVVVVLLGAGVLIGAYLRRTNTAGPGVPTAQASAEPKTADAAKAAMQKVMDRALAGDAAGAWDLLSKRGKKLISRADYVRYAEACPVTGGITAEVVDARLETPEKAIVIVKVLTASTSVVVVYEDGAWAAEPSAEQTASWSKPVDKQIAEAKANGSCVSSAR